jgi:hypothetical protein
MALRLSDSAVCLAAGFTLALVLSGCASNTDADNTLRDAAVYRSVIVDVVDRSAVDLDSSGELPTLFIETFDADGVALEVQVEIVNDLIEQYEVRFIDDREEAIEMDLAELPVRSNGLLIGLGPIVHNGAIDVRTELYLSANEIRAYRYTLAGRDDRWATVGAPEEIQPEGFVSAP